MSGWIPNSSSVSLVVGPIEAITMRRKSVVDRFFQACFGCDAEQMRQLDGSGEHRDIGLTLCDPADCFSQRCGVFGQIPLIDSDGCDFGTARAQSIEQFRIRFAVLLNSDATFRPRCGVRQQLTPGVWLGDSDRDRHLHLAQHGEWFGPRATTASLRSASAKAWGG